MKKIELDYTQKYTMADKQPEIERSNEDRMYDQCSEYMSSVSEYVSYPVKVFLHGDESQSIVAQLYMRYGTKEMEEYVWMMDQGSCPVSMDDVWMYFQK